jgi:hypothetical protein
MSINIQYQVRLPNEFDRCLAVETETWRAIVRAGGIERVAQGRGQIIYEREPWLHMPAQGRRFQYVNSPLLPPFDGLDYVITQFEVPIGYDGVIITLTGLYTGVGFAEGSGDITWRLRINQRWVRNYGAIQTSLGDLRTPYAIHGGGIRIYSNQLVRMYANIAVAALGHLDPTARIICGLTGWLYPIS